MFDQALWKESFASWPTWPCPLCNSVALALPKAKGGLLCKETGPSLREHQHEAWDVDWVVKRFAALLECHNPACGQVVAVLGRASVEEEHYYDENGETQTNYEDVYTPISFHPAPPIFAIPEQCPEKVRALLTASFALIWLDVPSAANRMRAGVEALLDDQRVQKSKSRRGKRQYLTTHVRIQELAAKHREAAEYLMAIKWLGNSGSHAANDVVSRGELLGAAELFEAALELIYVKKQKKFRQLASAINKRKGPKRVRRSSKDSLF